MKAKLTLHILLLGTSMSLSGCVSYAMRWKLPEPTLGDRIGAAVIDVVTLPVQAVVIPTLLGVDECRYARQRRLADKRATSQATQQDGK